MIGFDYRLYLNGIALNEWTDTGFPALPPGTFEFVIPGGSAKKGDYEFKVRARNKLEFGLPSSVSYPVKSVAPGKPPNLRIEPPPPEPPLEFAAAMEMAHAYGWLLRLSRLSDAELFDLVRAYNKPLPPTRVDVLDFLDAHAVRLVAQ